MNDGVGQVFLVGCPRSGTTLLQRLLSDHPGIVSLPETHFLQRLLRYGDRHRESPRGGCMKRLHGLRHALQARLGWVPAGQVQQAWGGVPELMPATTRTGALASVAGQLDAFADAMAAHCRGSGGQVWLEKTPDHLFYLRSISRYFPRARVIHLLRDGEEVVASLHSAAASYRSWRAYGDVDRAIDRWNRAVTESEAWLHDPLHLWVGYEQLIARPQQELARIFAFLGSADAVRPTAAAADISGLVRADEPWKQGAGEALGDRRKFQFRFDAVERARIRARLVPLSDGLQLAMWRPFP